MNDELTTLQAIARLRGMVEAAKLNSRDGARPPLWKANGCDEACEVLGLDPDNYRARATDAWPVTLHDRLVDPDALARHLDAI